MRKICTKYGNRHSKVRLDRIAAKYNVNVDVVISFAESQSFTMYNLPPKGQKKDRLFVSIGNSNKIKKHFTNKDNPKYK